MIGRAKKNGVSLSEAKEMAKESIGICPVCNKKIKNHDSVARKIDGLWICSVNCMDKFLKEKEQWTPNDWNALCNMQALYEERKRAEISGAKKELTKSGSNSLLSGLSLKRNVVN